MIAELKKDLEKWTLLLKLAIRNQAFSNEDVTYIQNEIKGIQELLEVVSE